MTEALALAPGISDGLTPEGSAPQITEIPDYLTRKSLREAQQRERKINPTLIALWRERGTLVEQKVCSIIASQTDVVARATLNPPFTRKSDITVDLVDGFGVARVKVEVKSSYHGIKTYKERVREGLPKHRRRAKHIRKKMDENNIILINGGESYGHEKTREEILGESYGHVKTREEILGESFYPQLYRIRAKNQVLMGHLANSLHEYHKRLASQSEPIQVFPAPTGDEQLALRPAS